jgi:hypothetical protein
MMRLVRVLLLLAPVIGLLQLCFTPKSGIALPLFARKYNFQCSQCHTAFPRLNAFGMQFRQNGYRLEGEKGKSPWEDKEFPLSLVGNVGIQYLNAEQTDTSLAGGGRVHASTTSFVQNAVEFHTAGTLAPNITFHFDNGFANGAGGTLESGMAFVQLDDVAKDGALNVKAGIYDAELPYLSDSRKTTLNGYITPVTLDGQGVELNGTKSKWTYAVGLNNSGRTTGKAGDTSLNNLENWYGWLMRDVSNGQLVAGRVWLDRQDPRVPDKSASGHFMAQASAYLNRARWAVIPGYTYESYDDLPNLSGVGTGSMAVNSGLLEALLFLDQESRWLVTGRYEVRHVGTSDVVAQKGDDTQTELNLSCYLNPNAKIALDWTHATFKMHNFIEDNPTEPKTDEVQLYAHLGY